MCLGTSCMKFAESTISPNLRDVKKEFEQSFYHKSLATIIRYITYLQQANQKATPPENDNSSSESAKKDQSFLWLACQNTPTPKLVDDFKSILGKNDLDDSLHGQWTRIIFDRFNKFHQNVLKTNTNQNTDQFTLTDDQIEILQACCEVHDWGEYAKGDINYDQKTDEHEHAEKIERDIIINEFLKVKYSQDQIVEITQIISKPNPEETIGKEIPKLRLIFNTIERIGYLRTGLKAWKGFYSLLNNQEYLKRKELSPLESQILKESCLTASVNVILNNLTILYQRSENFPYLRAFLANHKKEIESIFDQVNSQNQDIYDQAFAIYKSASDKESKINNFELARSTFNSNQTLQD